MDRRTRRPPSSHSAVNTLRRHAPVVAGVRMEEPDVRHGEHHLPPGRSTRANSRIASQGERVCSRTCVQSTRSTLWSGKPVRSAVPTMSTPSPARCRACAPGTPRPPAACGRALRRHRRRARRRPRAAAVRPPPAHARRRGAGSAGPGSRTGRATARRGDGPLRSRSRRAPACRTQSTRVRSRSATNWRPLVSAPSGPTWHGAGWTSSRTAKPSARNCSSHSKPR